MAKKTLLFGASGLLGSELQRALAGKDMQVIAPPHEKADMRDPGSLERVILEEKPDMIINVAALINVNELEKNPGPGWEINADGAGAIAHIIKKHALSTAYLFMSTAYVFGGDGKGFYGEDAAPSPINVYGETKARGEALIKEQLEGTNVPFYIIRTSWIYSKKRATFVDEVAKTLLAGEDFSASSDQRGNLTSAADLADAIVREFVQTEREGGVYHVVNASGEEGVSRLDIALEIARILGVSEERVKGVASDAVFAAKRPSAVLRNTKLPPLRDWREPLREHFASQ